MEELKQMAEEFLEAGKDNLTKKRFNAAISDFFKAIAIYCDYLMYLEARIIPKNHTERFALLKKYFPAIYVKVSSLFSLYTKSYNMKVNEKDVKIVKDYAYEIKKFIENKETI